MDTQTSRPPFQRSWIRILGFMALVAINWFARERDAKNDAAPSPAPATQSAENRGTGATATSPADGSAAAVEAEHGERAVLDAFAQRRSEVRIELSAVVRKNLPDDLSGSRHQKMILELPSGHTVLLAHNIDLAARVPASEGDVLRIAGIYEYTEKGGVVHWTHHDPAGRRQGGWIEHQGVRYE